MALKDLNVACVCASNMNRSVEAHSMLSRHGYRVSSFGTSPTCKLPGKAADKPNIFAFGTPYAEIYGALQRADFDLYMRNGVLHMLERNMGVKDRPERWQTRSEHFHIVITFDLRVFDAVVDDLGSIAPKPFIPSGEATHVFNLNVKDTHEDASEGAQSALEFLQLLEGAPQWEEYIDFVIEQFQVRTGVTVLHHVQAF